MLHEFFYETLKISVPISALILLILAITSKLNRKFRATWRLPVWIVIGFNLCIPFSYLLSLGNRFFPKEAETVAKELLTVSMPEKAAPVTFEALVEKTQPTLAAQLPEITPDWIFCLWLIGLVLCGTIFITNHLRLKRDIRIWSEPAGEEIDSCKNRKKKLPVYFYPKISTAMIVGCIRPIILLPKEDDSPEQLKVILDHEYMHYRRKDLWIKLFFQLVLLLHWYNPIVHYMVREASFDIELCCDSSLIKHYGKNYAYPYGTVIMQTLCCSAEKQGRFSLGWHSQSKMAKKRFANIYDKKVKKGAIATVTMIVFLISSGTYLYGASQTISLESLPEYDSLVAQAIHDHEIRAAEEEAKYEGRKGYVVLTKEMLEDPAYINPDGTFDEKRLTRDQAILQGAYLGPDSPWEDTIYHYNAYEDIIEPHVTENAKVFIYSNENGLPWNLKKGDTVSLEFSVDNQYYEGRGGLSVGYIKEETPALIQDAAINQNIKLEFHVPEDGPYQFYIIGASSSPILIKWVKISIV